MSYTVTIAEVINGLAITTNSTPYTVNISEVVNGVTVTSPASNTIAITNTVYPVTISYDAVVTGGQGAQGEKGDKGDPGNDGATGATGATGPAGPGVPTGGTAGQILAKINSTNYNTQWINVPATGLQNVVEDTTPQLGGDLDTNGHNIIAKAGSTLSISNASGSAGIALFTDGGIAISADPNQVIQIGDNIGVNAASFLSGTGGFTFSSQGNNVFEANVNKFGFISTPTKITTQGASTLTIDTNNSTTSAKIVVNNGSNGNIELIPYSGGSGKVTADTSTLQVGRINNPAKLTTNGTGSLTLNTNNGTNSSSIVILAGSNQDIQITPNGTGNVILDGQKWPQSPGTSGYVLKTDGSGQTSWVDPITLTLDVPDTQNPTIISDSSPIAGAKGDLWFNPINKVLSVWHDDNWDNVGVDDLQF